MWLFTKHGFFSVVCAREGDGKHYQPVDVNRVMVRARMREHLEALRNQFTDLLGEYEVQTSASTDYAYRLFVPKAVWTKVMEALAAETDYDNFKREVADHQGSIGNSYEAALHKVWSVMHQLQK